MRDLHVDLSNAIFGCCPVKLALATAADYGLNPRHDLQRTVMHAN